MSWFSDLFGGGGDSGGWQQIPDTPEQKQARKFLQDLYDKVITFPTKVVPGLSPLEEQAQSLVQNYIGQGTPTGVSQAIAELSKTVTGGYNPETSPAYQGYRTTSQLEENEAVNALRRRLQLGGLPASTPALGQEGKVRQGYSGMRLEKLGDLITQERNRQMAATTPLASLSTQVSEQPLKQAGAAEAFGAIPREIETQQEQAIWDALVATLTAPYTYQAPVAGTILNEPRYTYINPQQSSSGAGGGIGSLLGQILPSILGGGSSAGAGAGLAALGAGAGAAGAGALSEEGIQLALMSLMMACDEKIKDNIVTIDSSLEKVKKLDGKTYNYIFNQPIQRDAGLIAQDVEKVLPEAVVEIKGCKFIKLGAVIGLLVNAIKELNAKVEGI